MKGLFSIRAFINFILRPVFAMPTSSRHVTPWGWRNLGGGRRDGGKKGKCVGWKATGAT